VRLNKRGSKKMSGRCKKLLRSPYIVTVSVVTGAAKLVSAQIILRPMMAETKVFFGNTFFDTATR
jgi:hypothetical protein